MIVPNCKKWWNMIMNRWVDKMKFWWFWRLRRWIRSDGYYTAGDERGFEESEERVLLIVVVVIDCGVSTTVNTTILLIYMLSTIYVVECLLYQ